MLSWLLEKFVYYDDIIIFSNFAASFVEAISDVQNYHKWNDENWKNNRGFTGAFIGIGIGTSKIQHIWEHIEHSKHASNTVENGHSNLESAICIVLAYNKGIVYPPTNTQQNKDDRDDDILSWCVLDKGGKQRSFVAEHS